MDFKLFSFALLSVAQKLKSLLAHRLQWRFLRVEGEDSAQWLVASTSLRPYRFLKHFVGYLDAQGLLAVYRLNCTTPPLNYRGWRCPDFYHRRCTSTSHLCWHRVPSKAVVPIIGFDLHLSILALCFGSFGKDWVYQLGVLILIFFIGAYQRVCWLFQALPRALFLYNRRWLAISKRFFCVLIGRRFRAFRGAITFWLTVTFLYFLGAPDPNWRTFSTSIMRKCSRRAHARRTCHPCYGLDSFTELLWIFR